MNRPSRPGLIRSVADTALWWLGHLRKVSYTRLSRRGQRWLTGFATLVFLGVIWYAIGSIDLSWSELRLVPLAALFLTMPAPLLISAWEFRVTARAMGRGVSQYESIQVAVLGYAANLAPLPGSSIVRSSFLLEESDRPVGHVVAVTLGIGGVWVAVATTVAGLALIGLARPVVGLMGLGLSSVVALATFGVLRRSDPYPSSGAVVLAGLRVELASVLMSALRTYLALLVIGVNVGPLPALVIASGSALSTAVSLVPGGLGLREILSGLLGSLAGVEIAFGVLAVSLLRITGVLAMLCAAVGLRIVDTRQPVESHELSQGTGRPRRSSSASESSR